MSNKDNPRWWQDRRVISSVVVLGLLVLIVLLLRGKTQTESDGRIPVSGTVTLEGQPLVIGEIHWRPTLQGRGPAAQTMIENGRFQIPAREGPAPSEYHVTIITGKPVSKPKPGETPPSPRKTFTFTRTLDVDSTTQDFNLSLR